LILTPQAIAFFLTNRYLFKINAANSIIPEIGMLMVTFCIFVFPHRKTNEESSAELSIEQQDAESMISWRLKQMFGRSTLGKTCILFSCIFLAVSCFSFYKGIPTFVGAFAAYISGNLIAFMLIFQTAEDLKYSWLERALGISHGDFVDCYNRIALLLSCIFGSIVFLLTFFSSTQAFGFVPLEIAPHAAKAAVVSILPILISPWLNFQIDARRPPIAIMILIIVGIFLSTAVLAHWLGLLLVPLLRHFAMTYQEGRFYRADITTDRKINEIIRGSLYPWSRGYFFGRR
jgi:hypothetical protein